MREKEILELLPAVSMDVRSRWEDEMVVIDILYSDKKHRCIARSGSDLRGLCFEDLRRRNIEPYVSISSEVVPRYPDGGLAWTLGMDAEGRYRELT